MRDNEASTLRIIREGEASGRGSKTIPDRTAGNVTPKITAADKKKTTSVASPVVGQEAQGDGLTYRDKQVEGEKDIGVHIHKSKR